MPTAWLPGRSMENYPWQLRARAAGLTQRRLAKLLGHTEATVSSQLRGHWQSGVPQHVMAAIIVWEMLTPEQREAWLRDVTKEVAEKQPSSESDEAEKFSPAEFRALQKQVRDLTKRLAKAERRR
jgi:predicted transcriptional regulator